MHRLYAALRCRKNLHVELVSYGGTRAASRNAPAFKRLEWPSNDQLNSPSTPEPALPQTSDPPHPSNHSSRSSQFPSRSSQNNYNHQDDYPPRSSSRSFTADENSYQNVSTQPTRLHVLGLPFHVTRTMLFDHFTQFGRIVSTFIPNDARGRPAGYGFVHFANQEDAAIAREKMNGNDIEGRIVRVEFARKTGKGDRETRRMKKMEEEEAAEREREEWLERERLLFEERELRRMQWEERVQHRLSSVGADEEALMRRSVFIGGTWGLTEADLRTAFYAYGTFDVHFPHGESDGSFAHVEFPTEEDAQRLIQDGMERKFLVRGKYIRVEPARGIRSRDRFRQGGEEGN